MAILNLDIRIPKGLSSITLEQYQRYMEVSKEVPEEDNTNEFLNLKALEIFCGVSLKDGYNLPMSLFESVLVQLAECFEEKPEFVQRFNLTDSAGKTVEFGFIPKLDDISLGEYIDLEAYITDWSKMHKAMAVMYRPIVAGKRGKYIIEDYEGSEKWADVMKDAPVNIAMGAMVFFYHLGKTLSKYMTAYLMEEAKAEENTLLRQALGENGDGTSHFMHLQEAIYNELTQSQKFHYIKP